MGFEINELKAEDITPSFLRCVSGWRNRNLKYFFDQRPVSEASSRKFLESKINDPGSKFAVAWMNGVPIGHIGIIMGPAGVEPELDNLIVGGRAEGHYVAQELETWGIDYSRDKLGAKSLGLKVLSHNYLAKRLHIENGFVKIQDLSLHETSESEHRNLSVCTNGECELSHSVEKAQYWQLILG